VWTETDFFLVFATENSHDGLQMLSHLMCVMMYVSCRLELLCFAITYCTPKMIEPILRAKCLLETQVWLQSVAST